MNEKGGFSAFHCVNVPVGQGCKGCEYQCKEEAVYIGGVNCCSKHKTALENRMYEYWEARKKQPNGMVIADIKQIEKEIEQHIAKAVEKEVQEL
jgi:hypothetical protein